MEMSKEQAKRAVYRLIPRKRWHRVRKLFEEERLIARCRMSVLPTREWLCFLFPRTAIPTCRHCHLEVEYIEHLFFDCSSLDQSEFREVWNSLSSETFSTWAMAQLLRDFESPKSLDLEEAIVKFVKENDVFKRV